MSNLRRLRLIAYDVTCDRRRARLEKLVGRYAVRVQYSVFEGRLSDEQVDRLLLLAARIVDPGDDSLRVYRLCADCHAEIRGLGRGRPSETPRDDPSEVIV